MSRFDSVGDCHKYFMGIRFKDFFKKTRAASDLPTKKYGNFTLTFERAAPGHDAYVRATDEDGSPAGGATFTSDDGGKTYYSIDTYTYKNYQRRGLATAVYDFARENGLRIVPSNDYSPDGEAFVKAYFHNTHVE